MLKNDLIALVITFLLSLSWLRLNDFLAHKGWIDGPLSRKIIHMGTGPLFVVCWLLFQNNPSSRFLAALVPFAITMQFLFVGMGVIKDQSALDAMSRTGDRKEILRGPLYYGIVFVILTIFYWRDTPIGIIALMLLCGGDGLADVLGKKFPRARLPWSPQKTWIGSLSMFLGGWLFALIVLEIYIAASVFNGNLLDYLPAVTIISVVGAIIESLPFKDIDNISVPAAAVLLGHLLF